MNNLLRDEIYNYAKQWILVAGEHIRNKINEPRIITTKSNPNDLVTEMDKQTEVFFISKIKEVYPDHFIIGEEGFGDELETLDGIVWIIDPIDGTMNFVHQKRNFAISIGIYQDGIGEIGLIYDVMADKLYHAKRSEGAFRNEQPLVQLKPNLKFQEAVLAMNHYFLCENRLVNEKTMQQLVREVRGTRTYGSAALEFAYVAEGIIDAYLSMRLAPWDIAAGIILVNEVGGHTANLFGNHLNMLEVNSILACNPVIKERLLEFIDIAKK